MNKKNILEFILNLNNSERGKALLFFGVYLIFFLFVFLFCTINKGNGSNVVEYEKGNSHGKYDLSYIEKNNYSYKYNINVDNNNYIISGNRYNNLNDFTYNENNYFSNKNKYYIKNNNTWIDTENPNDFNYFCDIDNINKIINKATYKSKTSYEDDSTSINLEISTTTLVKLITDKDIDLDDEVNTITLYCDSEGVVNSIEYNLNTYGIYNNICTNTLNIKLEYSDFGKIKKIDNPIE